MRLPGLFLVMLYYAVQSFPKIAGKPPSLLFPSGGDIRHMGLDDNNRGPYGTIAFSQGSVGAIAVWWKEQLVYWTDLRKGTIKRAKVPGDTSFQGYLK